jgi:hypothetical protein
LIALDETGVPHVLPVLLASVAIAAAVGFVPVVVLGGRYLAIVGRIDTAMSCLVVLCSWLHLPGWSVSSSSPQA